MIDVGPVPHFADSKSHIEYPIVRDMDTNMYERQDGSGLEIGSYAHRAILHDPDEIPSIEEASLSPTELPFTQADFDPQMEDALELMPEIVGDESVGVKYAINGLLSLTPDGLPLLGETPEVKGLWSCAAVWVKEGPGIGAAVAEWMTHGESEIDLHSSDIARFWDHQKTRAHVRARAAEGFNKTYGIVHPGEQWASNRDVRLPPFHARERELGAVFFEAAGWERPHWYESNAPLLEEYGDRVTRREAEWDSRWWSPIINAEHLAMRDRAGMVDLSAFAIFDIAGPGALAAVQGVSVRQMDVPGRAGRLHADPLARRRLQGRPHDHAPRRGALPRRHRRRARRGRQEVVHRPPAGRRHRAALRRHHRLDDARPVGPAGPRHPGVGHAPTTSRTRASGSRRAATSRSTRCACSPRGSPTSATWAGSSTCRWSRARGSGTSSGRPAARTAPCRSGSASTAPPAGSRSATGPTGSSSRPSTTWSRRACRGRR